MQARGKKLRLHPVHGAAAAGDKRAAQARFDAATGAFSIPPRTAVVFVED
jgi:pullulanase